MKAPRRIRAGVQSALAVATAYQLALLAAGMRPRAHRHDEPPPGSPLRLAALIPAHDEERVVADAVRSLLDQRYPPMQRLVIAIADNCTDATAHIAADAGATVWRRDDPSNPGKGAALRWALERLGATAPDVDAVLVVDADCVASPNLCAVVDGALRAGAPAVQVRYDVSNPGASPTAALRWAGFALMHVVRPRGKRRLGLSSGLFGTGMAFRTDVLAAVPWSALSVTEDSEYHLRLVEEGHTVAYRDDATVTSPMPTTIAAARQQHLRWETGNAGLARESLRLGLHGLRRGDAVRVDAAVERLLPAQSLLLALTALTGLASVPARNARGVTVAASIAGAQALYVVGGLLSVRAPRPVWKALRHAPRLVLTRVGQALRIAGGQGATRWVRTPRA